MRNSVNIDRKQLGKIGYQAAPIRQILKLKLSPSEQLLLLNFFSNAPDWKVSINSISKSFGTPKNRNLIKRELNNLVKLNYITFDDSGYTINLDKIKSDYQLSIKADKFATSDISDTNDSRDISTDDTHTNKGMVVSLPEVDSDTTSFCDSNTTINKINNKEEEINDNEEINPVKENLDLNSNSSIDLGFGFDLENVALKQPKELIGNNYKLVNVNDCCTMVDKNYYDGITSNQEDTSNTNISSKPTETFKYLKLNDNQKSKLDLKFREIKAYNLELPLNLHHLETFSIIIICTELGISQKSVDAEKVNTFLANAIDNNSEFFRGFVYKINSAIKDSINN